MDTLSLPVALHSQDLKTKVYSADLIDSFKSYINTIKVLSLDCFDTLLWRKTLTPSDVFYGLNAHPLLQSQGFSAQMRILGEALAYKLKLVQTGSTQANLQEIYQSALPSLTESEINAAVEHELSMEIEACYAFQPIIELIKIAKEHNKTIIIVSDTYLQEPQLRKLLASKLPQEVMNSISHIFCSCEMGQSKSEGMFKKILSKIHVQPNEILHMGDNPVADFNAARALGVNALHFIQQHETMSEILRTQTVAAGFLDSTIRSSRPLISPFRGLFAQQTKVTPASLIGYASLGPIMYCFARFICDEVEALRLAGKKPKVLFLMRDAYLPALACEAILGKPLGANVRISRFAAIASSFRTKSDIDKYLAENINSMRFEDMCKQLLLPKDVTAQINNKIKKSSNPMEEFSQLIKKEAIISSILKESNAYFLRLKYYLNKQIGLESGDTLVFVDLGYTGTTQIKLAPVFKNELNIDVVGRYLIGLRAPNWLESRKGLLDPRYYDDSALSMLVTYIALVEQLSTSSEFSVIGFDKNGNPEYSDVVVSNQQINKLKEVQSECVRFISDAEKFIETSAIHLSDDELRDTAALSLARFLFLPTKSELQHLQTFEHDVNLGTNEVIPILNVDKGLKDLYRRSWLNSLKQNLKNMRMNYSAEWRAISLELSITLMAQQRFGFEAALTDLSHLRESIDVLIPESNTISMMTFEALPTHNGYYSLTIPAISAGQLGICFGKKYKWIELESADLIALNFIYTKYEDLNTEDASQYLALDKMTDVGGGLFECTSPESLLFFATPAKLTHNSHVLRIIFRPTVRRQDDITTNSELTAQNYN